jgi:ParB family chromosome partitioning protein
MIQEVKELPLTDLTISKGQARTSEVAKDIDELAESINRIGLLEPIVVAPAATEGKYEILTGQRRFLAHMKLGRTTILAAILPERVDDTTAKVISVTENLVRRDLNRRDLITACTALYKKYGSTKLVAEETGLPQQKVSEYVKYDRLSGELRELVDEGTVSLKAALRAQDAASVTGDYQADEAVKLAKEMTSMSGAQQAKLVQTRRDSPERDVDDIIEAAKAGEKLTQIIVTLGAAANTSLKRFATDEATTQDDAARLLIEEGLSSKGYFGEGE